MMLKAYTHSGKPYCDALSSIICCRIACVHGCFILTIYQHLLDSTLVLADFSGFAHENFILPASSSFCYSVQNKNKIPVLSFNPCVNTNNGLLWLVACLPLWFAAVCQARQVCCTCFLEAVWHHTTMECNVSDNSLCNYDGCPIANKLEFSTKLAYKITPAY